MNKELGYLDGLEVIVVEGHVDIFERIERCLTGPLSTVRRLPQAVPDESVAAAMGSGRDPAGAAQRSFAADGANAASSAAVDASTGSRVLAIVSVSVIDGAHWAQTSEAVQGLQVIWVGSAPRERESNVYPSQYRYILPLDFTCAELRALVSKVVVQMAAAVAPVPADSAFIAGSEPMQALLREVDLFADCNASVLIHGETGVGKERIAQRLHKQHQQYGKGPFVAVNCGAIPEGLFESLFFGHVKGAFTGALAQHHGYFEQASGGTLFLDEIGDLPIFQQVKLLRVLEDGTLTRLGSALPLKVDFRLVAATNKDMLELVASDRFRADLYYRIAVIELAVPNLEARGPVDKIAIFKAFLSHAIGTTAARTLPEIPYWLTDAVAAMRFAGNVRELRNLAERVGITVRQLGSWDAARLQRLLVAARTEREAVAVSSQGADRSRWDATERSRLLAVLEENGWRRQASALALGISRKVLWEKMRKYQLFDEEPAIRDGRGRDAGQA